MLTIKPNSFSHNVDTEMQLTALTFNWNLLKCVPVPFRLKFALCCFVSFRFDSFVSFCWLLQRIGPAECTETWLRDPLASFQIRHDQASRSAINALIFPAEFLFFCVFFTPPIHCCAFFALTF